MGRADWLKSKLDRERRLREHVSYLDENGVPLWTMPAGGVIDLGPGAGELLEIAYACGHTGFGVDARSGELGMGDDYLAACQLLHQRQGLSVYYCGLAAMLDNPKLEDGLFGWTLGKCWLINSRGSFEQMFAQHMTGEPHHLHHDAQQLSWRLDSANYEAFVRFFEFAKRALQSGGHLLLHCNGSQNHRAMEPVLRGAAKKTGFREHDQNPRPRVFHWLMD